MPLLVGLLIFMALFHPKLLSAGGKVLGPNYIDVYGWRSALGIVLQVVIHEAGTLLLAWRLRLPLRFRLFGFGAHATAILQDQPRRVLLSGAEGLARSAAGTTVYLLLSPVAALTANTPVLSTAIDGSSSNILIPC